MKKRQANWYSLDMLPFYLELSRGQLESAQEQQSNLERCQDRPGVLDDHVVSRIIRATTVQNENNWVFVEQCKKWRQQQPTVQQLADIEQVENNVQNLTQTNQAILGLAKQCKAHTIDRILEKDDAELALDFLMGKFRDNE